MINCGKEFNDFAEAVRPAARWLAQNGDPHTQIIIDADGARVVVDQMGIPSSMINDNDQ